MIRSPIVAILAVCAAIAGCGDDNEPAGEGPGGFDGDQALADVEAQVELGPRPAGSEASSREVDWIADQLEEAGVEDIVVQQPHRNVVATIPGSGAGFVVVGAHHDTAPVSTGFVGANDGASGVAVLLGLARSLPAEIDGSTVQLVFFDAEEARRGRSFESDGTRGSRQYVDQARNGAQGSPPLDQIEAMVLFDMVGDCELAIPREGSSDAALYDEFARAAAELGAGSPAPFEGRTGAISDDHDPFLDEGIAAVDLIDFTYGGDVSPGPYWHTADDTLDKVCAESLDRVGEAAALAIPRIAARGSSGAH